MEGGREDGKEGGADTELKTKTPHVNVGKYLFHMITTLVKLKLFAPT